MLRKKKKAPVAVQDTVLSDRLSFLDVIVDTCKSSGRYTLVADAGDATYTVMIDRGGPFNADGGGLSGSEVLVRAASLRRGTYTKLEGWPVDQPTYQLGLADALHGLVMGTKPEPTPLPMARGVNALRNAAFETAGKPPSNGDAPDPFAHAGTNGDRPPDPFAQSTTAPFAPTSGEPFAPAATDPFAPSATKPFAPSATNDSGLHQTPQQAGPWTMSETPTPIPKPLPSTASFETAPAEHPFLAPFAPATDAPGHLEASPEPAARMETAIAVAAPGPAVAAPEPAVADAAVVETAEPEAEPEPLVVEPSIVVAAPEHVDTISYLREAARTSDSVDPNAAPPAQRKPAGQIKRRILQFMLWTVEVDGDAGQYTFRQALALLAHSLGAGLALLVSPVTRPFTSRWHRARDDWRRSGEVTARQKAQKAKSTAKPSRAKR